MKKMHCLFIFILLFVNHPVALAQPDIPQTMFVTQRFIEINLVYPIKEDITKQYTDDPFFKQLFSHTLEYENIQNIKIENRSGLQRRFSINDGYEERIIRKVTYWLNNSNVDKEGIEESVSNPSNKLTLNMSNGDVITIEPAYLCTNEKNRTICTEKEGELIVSNNQHKMKVTSPNLFDWLLVEWLKEPKGPAKQELLEEALYTRYLYQLNPSYSDFIMCPKIHIVPIDGDTRRHLVFASALNYSGHHGGDYDKLTFSVSDSNLTGLQITNVNIKKHISQEESLEQCRNFD
ncbi:hypothetical protein NCCP2222_17350 [Sporosarcina sp. NCCP-2222]|uniref:hypothetical protein n=1 Tax=Sporosarcina sp. NCCP-2222 TaxID=2935073 RepID=UPI002081E296|nr:hypothetical protein [Sporosarcina sp. NCCP-2222]GKV55788.1 hypothetical protein NCCP2222_17350 [Sporosarcina sp. NCCP-2222]